MRAFLKIFSAFILICFVFTGCKIGKGGYQYTNIPVSGGGYVTGLVAHPTEPDLFYARSDVGGAFRWNSKEQNWIPIVDNFGSNNQGFYSIESLCVDPNDPDIVYMAVGRRPFEGDVLRSTDRGETWQATGLNTNVIRLAANGPYRWAGERLAVDPNNSKILYLGTRQNGLWKNTDPTTEGNWEKVSDIPIGTGLAAPHDGVSSVGVTFVAFDKNSGTNEEGATKIIYVGVFGEKESDGVYRTADGGKTWSKVPNSPSYPIRGVVASDGTLYVAHKSGVSKCSRNGDFVSISDDLRRGEYSGICIDPSDPKIVIVAQQNMTSGNYLYRSEDGGETWVKINCIRGTHPAWWPNFFWFAKTSAIMLNPNKPNEIWYSDWYGIWRTEDVTASGGAVFNSASDHLEVTVVGALYSPPSGETKLFSGFYDISGFRHTSLTEIPTSFRTDKFNNTTSYAVYEADPNIVYMVKGDYNTYKGAGFKSTDNGKTWTQFDLPGDYCGGRIAVSTTNPDVVVWIPVNKPAHYSHDGGKTWNRCGGIPNTSIINSIWEPQIDTLASNKTGDSIFYIFTPSGEFYRSTDNGATFTRIANNGLPKDVINKNRFGIKTVPEQNGGVWVNMGGVGLFRSDDAGNTFSKVESVAIAQSIAFGKAKDGSKYPATIFLYGRTKDDIKDGNPYENRLYMSDDMGETWRRISDDYNKLGKLDILEGDRQVYGKVFAGTNGRGIFYLGPGK